MEVGKVNSTTVSRAASVAGNSLAAGVISAGCTYLLSGQNDKTAIKAFVLGKDSYIKAVAKQAKASGDKTLIGMAETLAKDVFPVAKDRGRIVLKEIAKNSGAVIAAVIAGSIIADILLKDKE